VTDFPTRLRGLRWKHPVAELSVEEVAARLETLTVIDVSTREAFEAGHVPGARLLDPATFTREDLPAQGGIVFYCTDAACTACRFAAMRAMEMGFTEVFVMPAGFKGWRGDGV
jgi:rhodanese-related sulfurtransferase